MEDKDFFWLVGFLEGEGSFCHGPPSCIGSPSVSAATTDEDIIKKVSLLFGRRYHKANVKEKSYYKDAYNCYIRGRPAIELMKKLKDHMSARRRKRIEEIIERYEAEVFPTRKILLPEERELIKALLKEGKKTQGLIAKEFGVSRDSINRISTGRKDKKIIA